VETANWLADSGARLIASLHRIFRAWCSQRSNRALVHFAQTARWSVLLKTP
jgi:hypothetical protein